MALQGLPQKELAITHFVKNGTLQNACSTRPRVVVGLEKSACSFAHRQVDEQPTIRSKKNDDKSAVAMLKKGEWYESPVINQGHDRPGQPGKKRGNEMERGSSKHRSSDAQQLGLCISRHDAAEVYSPEEHEHAETNPTCEIHEGYCESH